jgi:hypothetical protein
MADPIPAQPATFATAPAAVAPNIVQVDGHGGGGGYHGGGGDHGGYGGDHGGYGGYHGDRGYGGWFPFGWHR